MILNQELYTKYSSNASSPNDKISDTLLDKGIEDESTILQIELYRLVTQHEIRSFTILCNIACDSKYTKGVTIKQHAEHGEHELYGTKSIKLARANAILKKLGKLREYRKDLCELCKRMENYYTTRPYNEDEFYLDLVRIFCLEQYVRHQLSITVLVSNNRFFGWEDNVFLEALQMCSRKMNSVQKLIENEKAEHQRIFQSKAFWGWGNSANIDSTIVNKVYNNKDDNVHVYVKLKPNKPPLSNPDPNPVIVRIGGNQIRYNCTIAGFENKVSITKTGVDSQYDNIKFSKVFNNRDEHDNVYIFRNSLEPHLRNDNRDIFVAAYGQSGSGKSYLIMGDEKSKDSRGLIYYTLEYICALDDVEQIRLLPLQVYMGSVYNAFRGDATLSPTDYYKWFEDKKSKKFIYPEFNYVDMLDTDIPWRMKPQPFIGTRKDQAKKEFKECKRKDPLFIKYPPVRDILNNLFNNFSTVPPSNAIDSDAWDITEKIGNLQPFINELKSNIKRPDMDTKMKLNKVSSRSHLFLIFKIKFKNGQERYITFVDFGGIEDFSRLKSPEPESKLPENIKTLMKEQRTRLINQGLTDFRRMMQKYMGTEKRKYGCNDIIGSGKDPIVRSTTVPLSPLSPQIKSLDSLDENEKLRKNWIKNEYGKIQVNKTFEEGTLRNFESSAVFNLIRGTSGIFAPRECNHIIYGLFHSYVPDEEYTRELICNTTNTVLKFLKDFLPENK